MLSKSGGRRSQPGQKMKGGVQLTQSISAVDKGRARSAHHAARIRVGIFKSREGQSCEEQSKLTQQCQAIAAAGGPSSSSGGTPLMASDVVKLSETVDTTLIGETKLVGKDKMKEMWERCIVVNREPPPMNLQSMRCRR